jgi:glycosyltransferase involved in cell wall biosynthesis
VKVLFLSIVPSPYQRDLFGALDALEGIDLSVKYAQANLKDSPFKMSSMKSYEEVYPSLELHWKSYRFVLNWKWPRVEDYDVIVINGYYTTVSQVVMRKAAGRVPLVFWGERMIGSSRGLRGMVFRMLTRPMEGLDAVVAIGKGAHRDYGQRYPGKKIYRLPYYCDISGFLRRNRTASDGEVRFLLCGQMIHRKGVDLLLQAFDRILKSGYRARLILVGWEAQLPEMMDGLPESTRQRIEVAGFQPTDKLPEVFERADVFVLPSRYDGWGVVVNQALGAGMPVICSDAVGSAEDLVEPGRNGIIFPSGDVDALETAMTQFLDDPGRIESYGRHSRELARELTPEAGARGWATILEEVYKTASKEK